MRQEMTPEEIRQLREELGVSREKFAKAFGLSLATISRWESGKAHPSSDQKEQLEALEELVRREEIDKKKLRRFLDVAGSGGTITAAAISSAISGVALSTPLGAAIGALVGGSLALSRLAALFKNEK